MKRDIFTPRSKMMILSTLENQIVTKKDCASPIFDLSCDVLCVGAGSAGVYAADSAAQEGASVILCEIGENIGGMNVCGNVTGYYYGAKGGSFEQDDAQSKSENIFLSSNRHWEQRQVRLTRRLQKSGVKLLCRHSVLGLYIENGRVVGAWVFADDKFLNIKAKITIDATSDGHLIRMTDVPKYYGKTSNGAFVPFGVFMKYTKDNELKYQNNDSGIMNQYDGIEFSRKTILAHACADHFLNGAELVNLALHTGVREGLSFEGEQKLVCEDVLLQKPTDKILFWAYSDLDRHGSERATEEEIFQNWWVVANLSTVTISIPVPLGSIVPKGIKGLVSAGRCLCIDTYLQSAVRMNRDMFRMGECVGIACAIAARTEKSILDIDYSEYLSKVRAKGCFDGYNDRTFCFDNSYRHYLNKMKSLGRTPDPKYSSLKSGDFICEKIDFDLEKNLHLLQTDTPGVAIWSLYLSKNQADKDKVFDMMQGGDDLCRYNCAIALGLARDERAIPTLVEILQKRDPFFFKDNRRSNQFRSVVAVCLLGKIGREKDLPMLFELLSDEEFENPMYHSLQANYLYHAEPDRNFVYFQMITHTCMAIYKIYLRNALDMKSLNKYFKNLFADDKILRRITDAEPKSHAYEETSQFIEYILRVTDK